MTPRFFYSVCQGVPVQGCLLVFVREFYPVVFPVIGQHPLLDQGTDLLLTAGVDHVIQFFL